jgi:hypothetical protein
MTEQPADKKRIKQSSKKITYSIGEAEKIAQDLKRMLQKKPQKVQIKALIEKSYDDIMALQNRGFSLQEIAQRFCTKDSHLSSKNLEALLRQIKSGKEKTKTPSTSSLPQMTTTLRTTSATPASISAGDTSKYQSTEADAPKLNTKNAITNQTEQPARQSSVQPEINKAKMELPVSESQLFKQALQKLHSQANDVSLTHPKESPSTSQNWGDFSVKPAEEKITTTITNDTKDS